MASRRPRISRVGSLQALIRPANLPGSSICPFCSVAPVSRPRLRSRRDVIPKRFQSTSVDVTNPRQELEDALEDLQKHAPTYVNIPRLQLALQGLRQTPGQEAIRVAVLGQTAGGDAGNTAKNVLRVLLTDPLGDEQEWEKQLKDHDPKHPLIVRVRPSLGQQSTLTSSRTNLLSEINVSSPEWNGLDVEFLFKEMITPERTARHVGARADQDLVEAFLVPTVDIPSAEDRVTPMATPVHKALLVAEGMNGAVAIATQPLAGDSDTILPAVNLKGVDHGQLDAPFKMFDVSLADKSIDLFRQSPKNAMEYERLWFKSNLPALVAWLKTGLTANDTVKPAVRILIRDILYSVFHEVQEQDSRRMQKLHVAANPRSAFSAELDQALAIWAQKAHAELQEELDLAFTGRRWRKLGWWQLFWRVDDVAMLTNEMLSQRFLPTAEQEMVYLTGQIAKATKDIPKYPQPVSLRDGHAAKPEAKRLGSGELAPMVTINPQPALPKWPGHIAFTRRYLQNETIPALQALAQRLVMQSLGTSGVTTSLAALLYVSSFSSTIYEAGAVAALGIMWSFSRLQKKWDAARTFWEGEVREEGRKAVKGAEESMAEVLETPAAPTSGESTELDASSNEHTNKVHEILQKASVALDLLK